MKKTIKIILVLAVAFLSGCASKSFVITHESLQNKGLLIGHYSSSDYISNGYYRDPRGEADGPVMIINGEGYKGIKNNYMAVPLPPGKYVLSELFSKSGGSMGAVTTTSTTRLPINAKFEIKKGEITNLGEIFLLAKERSGKRYSIYALDNDVDMKAYMNVKHKEVYRKFKKKTFNKANMKYIKKKDVNKLRIAALRQSKQNNNYIMVGSLGSLAITKRNKKGTRIQSIKFIKTNTFNRPHNCTFGKTKTACLVTYITGKEKLFLADKTKYRFFNKPAQIKGGKAVMLKDNSIMWMNYDFTFYKTKNLGKTWKGNTKYKKNVEMSFWDELGGNYKTPNIYEGKNGFYITAVSGLDSILHVNYKTGKVTKTSIPVKGDGIGEMVETAKGLYVRTDSKYYFSDTEIYFKDYNKPKWKKSIVPKSLCWKLKVKNYNAGTVSVSCRDKLKFQTTDLANSWQKIN